MKSNNHIPETGKQTQISSAIVEATSHIPGEGEILIKNVSAFLKSFRVIENSKEPNFRRTADEIVKSRTYDGCNEAGVAFVALLRAKLQPAVYIEALQKYALEHFDPQNPNLSGHVFIETVIEGQLKIVNSTTGEITDNIPDGFLEVRRGLDSWDIGLKDGFKDLQKLFEEIRSKQSFS